MATVRELLLRKGTDVVTARSSTTVLEAARLMNACGIGAVIVSDGGPPLGIFTERDLMRRVVAELRDPGTTPLAAVMTRDLVVIRPEATIEECAGLMTSRRIRHLPVMKPEGLAGLITSGDLMAFQVAEQAVTIAQLSSYVYENR